MKRDLRAAGGASRGALTHPARAMSVGFIAEEGVLLGALQAASDGPPSAVVRGTPGCAVRVGRGTLHVVLALPELDCPEPKILNRHVRPLLAAITKATSVPARYFDRDWIDVRGHPVAHVGFAHERATGHAVVEAFVAVRTPFAISERASYRSKAPVTLEEVVGTVDDAKLLAATRASYDVPETSFDGEPHVPLVDAWQSRVEEAIGPVCAGRDAGGRLHVGGEWMASFDAVRDLEERLARGEPVRSAVDSAFAPPHTALFGVRSLESFARAIDLAVDSR